MHWLNILSLFTAAFFAGILNSVAGGGSFLTFPALIWNGISPIVANASSTVALFPGSFAATWAYRKDMREVREINLKLMVGISLVGGFLGARLLLKTPESVFVALVPYLLAFATFAFAFGNKIRAWLNVDVQRASSPARQLAALAAQFTIAIYGGYFGGGIGIMMLAVMSIMGMKNIHSMNAAKSLLAGCMNGVAVVLFLAAHAIEWKASGIMLIGAVIGGFTGASLAKKINPAILRGVITGVGVALTIYFFVKR